MGNGDLYFFGIGVAQDFATALRRYEGTAPMAAIRRSLEMHLDVAERSFILVTA